MNSVALHPLQILIVEDDPGTLEILGFVLETLPEDVGQIIPASTVMGGRVALAAARDQGRPFGVIILDFKIPERSDLSPKSDFSLGAMARQLFPKAFIIQITAFGQDPEIRRFLLPSDLRNPEVYDFIPKDQGWTDAILKRIIEARHTRRVRDAFENLFPPGQTGQEALPTARRRPLERSEQDRRLLIASLCDDAGRHWDVLSQSLREDLTKALGYAQDAASHHVLGVRGILVKDELNEDEIALPDDDREAKAP